MSTTKITNLRKMRKRAGLTQTELSAKAQVGLRSIQMYEQGINDINRAQGICLYRMAQALECSMEDLLETPNESKVVYAYISLDE